MLLSNLSLILEGGGMRGMFSAGVFDAFLEKELVFPHIAGVSAGVYADGYGQEFYAGTRFGIAAVSGAHCAFR